MKKSFSPAKAAITCGFMGHDYKISHIVNDRITEQSCSKCGKQITNTIYGNSVPLTAHYSRINKALHDLARKKTLRALIYS